MPKGHVKWFNNAKGFGFIISDAIQEDLFAHYSQIQMDGYKTLKAGQEVDFELAEGKNGYAAINITAASTVQGRVETRRTAPAEMPSLEV